MPYDLFISYSRKDNQTGRITELKEQIEKDYREFSGEDLHCFFDLEDIHGMDDWRHRILAGLRESSLLLLVLSPAYLDSPYCEWEITEYLKYEHSRAAQEQGVAPVYFVAVPGLDSPEFNERAAAWVAAVRRRNHFDLRPWHDEGAAALQRIDFKNRLEDLERTLTERLSKLRHLTSAPGNLPAHNPRFVGREAEMLRLHESAGLGRFGVLTAIQGMGGLGKTALAIQYACVYADFYPGGRWLVGCAGEKSLAAVLRKLDADLNIELNEAEKKDDIKAAKRIIVELEARAKSGAKKRSNEKNIIEPRTLLLLDNVDYPELLQPPESDLISGKRWLHIIATTRISPEDLGLDSARQTILTVDELPMEDALRLIESYQPGGRFTGNAERIAAGQIVEILGGFTLAVEVVGVYLGECMGRVTCTALLQRLKKEGFSKFEGGIAKTTKGAVNHVQKLVGATLAPTIDLLSSAESLALAFAALLPPDSIPLPWLRSLAAKDFPELGQDAEPGYDDPWLSLVNRLLGMRFFQIVDLDPENRVPRLVQMHRLTSELVRERNKDKLATIRDLLSSNIKTRCNDLESAWHETQWEILPLIAYAQILLETKDHKAPTVIRSLCQWLTHYDYGRHSEPILRTCLAQQEADPQTIQADVAVTLCNLGWALTRMGRAREAESYHRRALEIDEQAVPMDEHALAVRCNQLAACLVSQGQLLEPESLLRRALALFEKVLGTEHPYTLACLHNLGFILMEKAEYIAAEPLLRKALSLRERILGNLNPRTLYTADRLGMLLMKSGNIVEANSVLQNNLAARQQVLGSEHPDTLSSVNNLAELLLKKRDYAGAEPLFRRALEIRERVLGPEHPDTFKSTANLADLLEKTDRSDETRLLRLHRVETLASRSDTPPLTLRELELDCFKLCNYEKAEELLNRLLQTGFEPASTRHHLARVCLMNDRFEEAKNHVTQAWADHTGAKHYIIARLLWLQIALTMLEAGNRNEGKAGEIKLFLSRLKTVFQNNDAFMEWTMPPVLDHLKPRLKDDDHALLMALVSALSDPANLEKLNEFQSWREVEPVAIEEVETI